MGGEGVPALGRCRRSPLLGGVGAASKGHSPETWAVAPHYQTVSGAGSWTAAAALSGHNGLWPGWGTKEVVAPNLGSKVRVDADGIGDDWLGRGEWGGGWSTPPGLKWASRTELEVRLPESTEPKKLQKSGADSRKLESRWVRSDRIVILAFLGGGLLGRWAPWGSRCLQMRRSSWRKLLLLSSCRCIGRWTRRGAYKYEGERVPALPPLSRIKEGSSGTFISF